MRVLFLLFDSLNARALYGIFGGAINATDGRFTYFRYPTDMEAKELNEYTLMPMHNQSLFEIRELEKLSCTEVLILRKAHRS